MKTFIKTAMLRPVTVCVLVIILLAAGVLATTDMSINLLPDINMPMLGVTVVYPGASAANVESDVTLPVESALRSVSGLNDLQTMSYDNVSVAVLTFDYGTDLDKKTNDLEQLLGGLSLPDGCRQPTYTKVDLNGSAAASVALFNAQNDADSLAEDAEKLKTLYSSIEGVGSVKIVGSAEKQITIEAFHGLDIASLMIAQALGTENLDIPFGTVTADGNVVSVRNASDSASVLDVMRLPVKLQLGNENLNTLSGLQDAARFFATCTEQQLTETLARLNLARTAMNFLQNQSYSGLATAKNNALFADIAQTSAFDEVLRQARAAENAGESFSISDAQFAAMFAEYANGTAFSGLINEQTVAFLRSSDYIRLSNRLQAVKRKHVDSDGNAVYSNGVPYVEEDGKAVVYVEGKRLYVNAHGRLADGDGALVDEQGAIMELSEQQIAENFYTYGDYVILSDGEWLELYEELSGYLNLSFNLTEDFVRLLRCCDFGVAKDVDYAVVSVGYLGSVQLTENNQAYAQYNGVNSVVVEVYAAASANTTDVVKKVRNYTETAQIDSTARLLDDKSAFINESISTVLSSIIIGGVLAIFVIYLFVRKVGSSLIISVTMPLSVLVALLGMWAMGITLNMVSLGGLAVGIGMLVDNSIVVLESITKHRDGGKSVFDSCLDGTKEVAGSLLASTLTNVCVFVPILFTKGLTREIFYDLVWAVIFSITMSLIVAVTVIPSLYNLVYGRVLKNKKQPQRSRKKSNVMSRGEKAYGKLLSKVLKRRVLVCVVALAVFGVSVLLVFATGTEFLPSVDKGLIEVNIALDNSATLEEVTDASMEAAKLISDRYGSNLDYVSVTVGKQGLLALENTGRLRVQIEEGKLNTAETAQEIRSLLGTLPTKTLSVTEVDGVVAEITSGYSGMSVTLLAPSGSTDMDALAAVSAEVAEKLKTVENVASVTDNAAHKTEEVSFRFDKTLCAQYGVEYSNLVSVLRVGLSGYTAANIQIDGKNTDVVVIFAPQSKTDVQSLTEVTVGFNDGNAVTVGDLLLRENGKVEGAGIVRSQTYSEINKKNGRYYATIDIESYGTDTGTVTKRVADAVNDVLATHSGYEYAESGVASYLSDAFSGLAVSLIAAFLLLYGVMACQFESLVKPFVVIMSIPFGFTGGFLALAVTGTTLNVVSFVGVIMLMGVIVNDAIVMVDKIDSLIADGMTSAQAVVQGCSSRLRPILMTSLTTILALVPMALGLGKGGGLMQPMGIVVLGGLALGTLVTLVLIPCFYCLIKGIRFDKNDGEQLAEAEQRQSEDEQQIAEAAGATACGGVR